MGKLEKIKDNKKIGLIAGFISSEKGQRFFNFAYSIGAAIVIWGALFKILHLPGGNALLSIGMGTEVLMFLLTAFDRPPKEYHWEEVFPILDSKKEEDRPHFNGGGSGGSGVYVAGNGGAAMAGGAAGAEGAEGEAAEGANAGGGVVGGGGVIGGGVVGGGGVGGGGVVIGGGGPGVIVNGGVTGIPAEGLPEGVVGGGVVGGGVVGGGGVIMVGGGYSGGAPVGETEFIEGEIDDTKTVTDADGTRHVSVGAQVISVSPQQAHAAVGLPQGLNLNEEQTTSLTESIAKMAAAADQLSRMAELTSATQTYLDQMSSIATEMQRLHDVTNALNNVSEVLLKSYEAITQHSNEINESSTGYVEQMQNLNRNIGGLNTIYEIQLKSVSSQLDAIDRVNRGIKDIRDMYEKSAEQSSHYCEETEKMARYMKQLNQVYEKMITAMTINMYRQAPAVSVPEPEAETNNEEEAN